MSSAEPITEPDFEPATDINSDDGSDRSDLDGDAGISRDEWETVRSERDHSVDALQRSQADFANYRQRVALDLLARDDVERIASEPGDRFDATTQHAVASTAEPAAEVVVSNLIRPGLMGS